MFLIYLLGGVVIPLGLMVLASIRSRSKMIRKYGAEALKQIRERGPAPM